MTVAGRWRREECGQPEQRVPPLPRPSFFLAHNEVGTGRATLHRVNKQLFIFGVAPRKQERVRPWANLQARGRQPIHQSAAQTAHRKLS